MIKVTAHDEQTGETGTCDLSPGQYVIICAEPMHVAHEQRYRLTGTVVITLKKRPPVACSDTPGQQP